MNTPQRGRFRWMIFKDRESWVGVALEFNIVITGDDPRVVETELHEAVTGYLESAKKLKGFRSQQVNTLLNQNADKEYESKWAVARKAMQKDIPSPFSSNIYKAGISNLVTT